MYTFTVKTENYAQYIDIAATLGDQWYCSNQQQSKKVEEVVVKKKKQKIVESYGDYFLYTIRKTAGAEFNDSEYTNFIDYIKTHLEPLKTEIKERTRIWVNGDSIILNGRKYNKPIHKIYADESQTRVWYRKSMYSKKRPRYAPMKGKRLPEISDDEDDDVDDDFIAKKKALLNPEP